MKIEKKCKRCGKVKEIEGFPLRGSETDRFGEPIRRGVCKKCETSSRTKKNRQQKEKINSAVSHESSKKIPAIFQQLTFIEELPSDGQSYAPWSDLKGRELTDEEKVELDACTRELIITMMDLVIKERGDL